MLDVAVIMFTVNKIGENYKMVISLCFYNPFAGDGGKRWPETKCFNISNQNTELSKIDEFWARGCRIFININCESTSTIITTAANQWRMQKDASHAMNTWTATQSSNCRRSWTLSRSASKVFNSLTEHSSATWETSNSAKQTLQPTRSSGNYNTTKLLFLHPVFMFKLFFNIRTEEVKTQFVFSMFFQFDRTSRILFFAMLLSFPIIYATVYRLEAALKNQDRNRKKTEMKTMTQNIFFVVALHNNISMKQSALSSSRMVVSLILFFTVVISAIFQGTIISSLNNKSAAIVRNFDQLRKGNYLLKMTSSMTTIF